MKPRRNGLGVAKMVGNLQKWDESVKNRLETIENGFEVTKPSGRPSKMAWKGQKWVESEKICLEAIKSGLKVTRNGGKRSKVV